MKLNKLAAAGATLALAVGSIVGISTAATAAEVPQSDIVTETHPYPVEKWFVGEPPKGEPAGPAMTQTATGLTIPSRNQLLYGQSVKNVTGAAFEAFVKGVKVDGSGPLIFQVPLFLNGATGAEFTTFMQVAAGTPSTEEQWTSSQAVGGLKAFDPVPFSKIVEVINAAGGDTEILAFGVGVFGPANQFTAELRSVTSGAQNWTFATPVVTAEVPTPIEDSASFTG